MQRAGSTAVEELAEIFIEAEIELPRVGGSTDDRVAADWSAARDVAGRLGEKGTLQRQTLFQKRRTLAAAEIAEHAANRLGLILGLRDRRSRARLRRFAR